LAFAYVRQGRPAEVQAASFSDPVRLYGWRFFPPRLSQDGLLHLPGYTGGTGSYNADRLYQWNDDTWAAIDITTVAQDYR
jgi:hypothetical protein